MRILLLNWRDLKHPRAGGAERFVDEVAQCWTRSGHEVTLFCAAFEGSTPRDTQGSVAIVRRGGRLSVYVRARSFMRKYAWDVIVESVNTRPWFAHSAAPNVPSAAIFYQLARDVWHYEAPPPVAAVGRFILEPLWLRRYRRLPVVALSESTGRDLRAAGIRNVQVVPPGRPASPPHTGGKEQVPTLLFVGRLQRSKRPDHAIAAFEILRRRIPDARLWIVGDGPMREKLQQRARPAVTFFGRVDEATKWDLLGRAHLLLVPSVREGWGLVVSEGAAAGTPAVGYRVPGLVDSIADGKTGWLAEPSPEAMAAKAQAALADMKTIARQARESLRELSWDRTADAILQTATSGFPPR